jgi:hypothetical protein
MSCHGSGSRSRDRQAAYRPSHRYGDDDYGPPAYPQGGEYAYYGRAGGHDERKGRSRSRTRSRRRSDSRGRRRSREKDRGKDRSEDSGGGSGDSRDDSYGHFKGERGHVIAQRCESPAIHHRSIRATARLCL